MRVDIKMFGDFDVADVVNRSPIAQVPGAGAELAVFVDKSSLVWIGEIDGTVACVWGVIQQTILSDRAYLWLLATELIDDHKFIFIRHSQRCVETLLGRFSLIVGHCHVHNARAMKWLKWLGAEFGDLDGLKVPFQIRKK